MKYYEAARDMSWRVLLECKITSLPVDLNIIADNYNIEIVGYSDSPLTKLFNHEAVSGDGFITRINKRKVIFLNDNIKTRGRRRFTVAHELGHGILNHPLEEIVTRNNEVDSKTDPLEMQANVFSRDILAPACVLEGLGVTNAEEIVSICDISKVSAQIRLERLNMLRERGMFNKHPLERQVSKQFEQFINAYKIV